MNFWDFSAIGVKDTIIDEGNVKQRGVKLMSLLTPNGRGRVRWKFLGLCGSRDHRRYNRQTYKEPHIDQ